MQTTSKRHRLGVLGLGEGRSILSAATRSPGWEVALICDLNADLCRQRQGEFNLPRWTLSYAEMLADPTVEVISIYTPDSMHAEHVKLALQAGKHVICTKPLFDTLQPAAGVAALLAASDRRLMVGTSCRFFETFTRQQAESAGGTLGMLLSAEAHYHGDKREGSSGQWGKNGEVNWMYTGMVHPVDLIYWNIGPIAEVTGYGLTSPAGAALGSQKPDCFHFALRAENGGLGLASGFYGTPHTHFEGQPMIGCVLRGTRGTSVATYPTLNYYINRDDGQPEKFSYEQRSDYYFRFGGHTHHAGEFQNYLEYFARCLDNNMDPRPNLADGIHVLAVLTAMERALASHKPVTVASVLRDFGLEREEDPALPAQSGLTA